MTKQKWNILHLSELTSGSALAEAKEGLMDYAYVEYDGNLPRMAKWLGCTSKSLYNYGFKSKRNSGRPQRRKKC